MIEIIFISLIGAGFGIAAIVIFFGALRDILYCAPSDCYKDIIDLSPDDVAVVGQRFALKDQTKTFSGDECAG